MPGSAGGITREVRNRRRGLQGDTPFAETYAKTDDHSEFLAEVDKLRQFGWTILGTTSEEGIVTAWVTREGA